MSSTAPSSPSLPVEVIEHIIDMSSDDPQALSNLFRCCRALLTRSRCHLFTRIFIDTMEKMRSFGEFLDARPWLPPLIRRVTIGGGNRGLLAVVPVPAFTKLPNLRHWEFSGWDSNTSLSFNRFMLTRIKFYGARFHTLTLGRVIIPTYAELGRLLLAFPNLHALHCEGMYIRSQVPSAVDNTFQQRLIKQSRLTTLTIGQNVDDSAAMLLLDICKATLEQLTVDFTPWDNVLRKLSQDVSQLPQLRALSINLNFGQRPLEQEGSDVILRVVKILRSLGHSRLTNSLELTTTIPFLSLYRLFRFLSLNVTAEARHELEQALLVSPMRPILTLSGPGSSSPMTRHWMSGVEDQFPKLCIQKLLRWEFTNWNHFAAHEERVTALIASPDGKWFATGSHDSAIFVWDAVRHTIVWHWVAHNWEVNDLAFSPDSRYILSIGSDATPKVWDLGADAALAATLTGHTSIASCCSWATTGLLATGSNDGTVRIWDGPKEGGGEFEQRYVLTDPEHSRACIRTIGFSPDGAWLLALHNPQPDSPFLTFNISPGRRCEAQYLRVWDLSAESGPVHKAPCKQYVQIYGAEFQGTIVSVSRDGTSSIWGVDAKEAAHTISIDGAPGRSSYHLPVMFAPDGNSVLIHDARNRTVLCWDWESGQVTRFLNGQPLAFFSHDGQPPACFSPDGQYIAAVSADGVHLWRPSDGSCVTVPEDKEVQHVAFSKDGRVLATGNKRGDVKFHQLDNFISM